MSAPWYADRIRVFREPGWHADDDAPWVAVAMAGERELLDVPVESTMTHRDAVALAVPRLIRDLGGRWCPRETRSREHAGQAQR